MGGVDGVAFARGTAKAQGDEVPEGNTPLEVFDVEFPLTKECLQAVDVVEGIHEPGSIGARSGTGLEAVFEGGDFADDGLEEVDECQEANDFTVATAEEGGVLAGTLEFLEGAVK